MRIAYLSSAKLPSKAANTIHIIKMCQAFARLGNEVYLFAYVNEEYSTEEIFSYYDVNFPFHLVKLVERKIPFYERINGLLVGLKTLKLDLDFVIGRNINACFFSCLFGTKTYFEIHAPIKNSGKFSHFLFRLLIKKRTFKRLILITKALEQYYLSRYPNLLGKTLILADGADEVIFENLEPVGIKRKNRVNIGFTGHLYAGKGMEVISQLLEYFKDSCHFHIVGGKDKDIDLWKRNTECENITFHGFQPPSSVKNYLNEFDIVLLPNQREVGSNAGVNIGDWTSPLKLFEYMAMGKAIIASDLAVLREVLIHKENSLLCKPELVDDWVMAINELINNIDLRNRIGNQAKKDLISKYTWTIRAEKVAEDFYGRQ